MRHSDFGPMVVVVVVVMVLMVVVVVVMVVVVVVVMVVVVAAVAVAGAVRGVFRVLLWSRCDSVAAAVDVLRRSKQPQPFESSIRCRAQQTLAVQTQTTPTNRFLKGVHFSDSAMEDQFMLERLRSDEYVVIHERGGR